MRSRIALPLLFGLMVIFAGCAGFTNSTSTENTAGTSSPESPSPTTPSSETTSQRSTSDAASEVKERALNAEKERVTELLENRSNISGSSVGVYGTTKATVVNRSTGTQVRVTISYSYEYNCGNESGAVDGATTTALYTVSKDKVKLNNVTEGVTLICTNQ